MRTPDDDRPDATRARRAIVLLIGLYLGGQIAVGFAMDHAPLWVRFPQAARVMREAAGLPRPPDIVILGSSRFLASVKTDVMDEALRTSGCEDRPMLLNGGVEGGDAFVMDLLLRRLLATGARPRLALIEISPETMARRNGWMNAHIALQLTFPQVLALFPQIVLAGRVEDVVASRLNPVYFYRRELLIWITGRKPPFIRVPDPAKVAQERPNPESNDAAAPEPGEGDPRRAAEEFRHRAARGARHIRKWLRGYEISGLAAESLDRLIARCRTRGIEVILIAPPLTGVHRAEYTGAIESAFQAHIKDLTRRGGVRYVDFRGRLPDDLFVDNHHTNAVGARAFSRLLAQEVVRPAWLSLTPNP